MSYFNASTRNTAIGPGCTSKPSSTLNRNTTSVTTKRSFPRLRCLLPIFCISAAFLFFAGPRVDVQKSVGLVPLTGVIHYYMYDSARSLASQSNTLRYFPVDENDTDGLEHLYSQLVYMTEANNRTRNRTMKYILRVGGFNWEDWLEGRERFIVDDCPIKDCWLTSEGNRAHTADALFITQIDHNSVKAYLPKASHQIWIARHGVRRFADSDGSSAGRLSRNRAPAFVHPRRRLPQSATLGRISSPSGQEQHGIQRVFQVEGHVDRHQRQVLVPTVRRTTHGRRCWPFQLFPGLLAVVERRVFGTTVLRWFVADLETCGILEYHQQHSQFLVHQSIKL